MSWAQWLDLFPMGSLVGGIGIGFAVGCGFWQFVFGGFND